MAQLSAKPQVDLQEIVLLNTVKRATEMAKSQIVGVLGRKPFTRVRIGRTDLDLGRAPQTRRGYSVSALFSSSNGRAIDEVEKQLATWLHTCHGQRFEPVDDGKSPLKTGNKTIYLAVL